MNLLSNDNVLTLLPQNNQPVLTAIESFLESVGVESKNTRTTYETALRDFFKATRNKELSELSEKDLSYTYMEVEKYRNGMLGKLKNSTINIKMIAVKRLFDKLVRYELAETSLPFEMKKLKEYDTKSYDSMSVEEVRKAIEVVEASKNGFEKGLLIQLAFVTGFRKHALMTLKFSNLSTSGNNYIIKVLDKGNKWSTKKIEKSLYDEIMAYQFKVKRDEIFKLSNTTIQRMMEKINKDIDFGDRYITFHSFKKASIEEVAIQTNFDIKAMQAQGNHADASTTLNVYMRDKNIEDMPLVTLDSSEPDLNVISDLTKDELCDIIKKLDRKTQIQIIELSKGQK